MSLMGKSNKRLLVHKDMPNIKKSRKHIDIILSPQFYTFLREELGIKFTYQAKQIAPSIFDDYLEDINNYQFFVYKEDIYWYFFAYNIDEITTFLEEKGVKRYQINKIFFAQELSRYLKDSILDLGDKNCLIDIDNIVTVLPKKFIKDDEVKELNLKKIQLKESVSISSSFGSIIPFKQTLILTTLLFILGGLFVADGNRAKNSIRDDEEKLDLLLQRDTKLSSQRIRESILAQYEPIDKIERLKRDILVDISKLLSTHTRLKELKLDDKKISAIVETDNINRVLREASDKKLKSRKLSIKEIRVERSL